MSWSFVEFSDQYETSNFDCGEVKLNQYLTRYMKQDLKRNAAVPTLAINDHCEVVGFYTLSSGSVQFENFPESLKRKIAPYPVPVARMGRLAVDQSMQGKGLGKELLFHAIDSVEGLSAKIGIGAIVVDAKNELAESFYIKYGFEYLQNKVGKMKSLFLII